MEKKSAGVVGVGVGGEAGDAQEKVSFPKTRVYQHWTLPVPREMSRASIDMATLPKLHPETITVEYLEGDDEDEDGDGDGDGDGDERKDPVILPPVKQDGDPGINISAQNLITVEIVSAKTLTAPEAAKPVTSITLSHDCSIWDAQAGDAFGIVCENDPLIVEALLSLLAWDPEKRVKVSNIADRRPISVRDIFLRHVDIMHFPKKSLLRHLAEFCSGEEDRQDLLFLSSKPGSHTYMGFAAGHANIIDFLHSFPTCRPTLQCLLNHLPPISPRHYSICNHPSPQRKRGEEEQADAHGMQDGGNACKLESRPMATEIEFIYSSMEYTVPAPNDSSSCFVRQGVCTSWLDRCVEKWRQRGKSGEEKVMMQIFPRPSPHFRLPQNPRIPVIMICAGTGVSPFMGFLRSIRCGTPRSLTWLMFGFRHRAQDFLFASELQDMLQQGTLTRLSLATSREPDSGDPKYVQDVLSRHSREVFEMMMMMDGGDDGSVGTTTIYICGEELTMIKGVNEALQQMLVEHGCISPKEAQARIADWTASKRLIRDVWV